MGEWSGREIVAHLGYWPGHAVEVASPLGEFVATTFLSVVVASVSYWTFERFFLRVKDRWLADAPPRQAELALPSAARGTVPPNTG